MTAKLWRDRPSLGQAVRRDHSHDHTCILLSISRKDLDSALAEVANAADEFKKAIAEHLELRSTVNRYGERNIDLVSGFAENVEIPRLCRLLGEPARVLALDRADDRAGPLLACRTCTTIRTTSSKSKCGSRSKGSKSGKNGS